MGFCWCIVVLAVAGTRAQRVHDSTEDLSGDETEAVPPGPGYGVNARRGCNVWCGCTGSVRSRYCCPTSISMCEDDAVVRQPNAGVICRGSICYNEEGRNEQPDIYSGRTVCRGSLCYRRGRTIVRPDGLCTSRLCDALRPASQPSASARCGADVNCNYRGNSDHAYHSAQAPPTPLTHRSAASARCGADLNCNHYGNGDHAYHSAHAPPTSLTYHSAASARCSADVNCNYRGNGDQICCNGQCRTLSSCNPIGLYGPRERHY